LRANFRVAAAAARTQQRIGAPQHNLAFIKPNKRRPL
jgi:hypothetical protein